MRQATLASAVFNVYQLCVTLTYAPQKPSMLHILYYISLLIAMLHVISNLVFSKFCNFSNLVVYLEQHRKLSCIFLA
jgi:membrane-bound metal-dependent hydrolase YbcI (DUF457 family)